MAIFAPGQNQNFGQHVTHHTYGRIDRNGTVEEILPARSVLDACKYIAHGTRDYARLEAGGIAGQSVCFTRGCLSVGKDDGIIARHGSMNKGIG